MKLTFDEADHVYRVDGVVKPSVTQLISAHGMGVDYAEVPDFVLERARERGIHIDQAVTLYERGELDESTIHDPWRPYFESYKRWKAGGVSVLGVQVQVYHPELDYCGTLDVWAQQTVADVKCSQKIHRGPYGLQLAAYTKPGLMRAGEGGELVPFPEVARAKRLIVQLTAKGVPNVRKFDDPEDYRDWEAVCRLAKRKERMAA